MTTLKYHTQNISPKRSCGVASWRGLVQGLLDVSRDHPARVGVPFRHILGRDGHLVPVQAGGEGRGGEGSGTGRLRHS